MEFQVFLSTLMLVGIVYLYRKKTSRFPPGPPGLPLIGNLLEFRKSPLTSLLKWRKQYGDIVGLQLGTYRAVLISGIPTMKEAFNNTAFNGRPRFIPFMLFAGGDSHGTLTSGGENWDYVRRFSVKYLNGYGFGRQSTEDVMLENVEDLVADLKQCSAKSESINLHDKLWIPVARYSWYILTGDTWSKDQLKTVEKALDDFHWSIWRPIGSIIWMIPALARLFPETSGFHRAKSASGYMHSMLADQIEHKRQKTDRNNNSVKDATDFLGAFIATIDENRENPKSVFHGRNGENQMQGTTLNMFITANETMSNTLNWATIYLSKYPHMQKKLQVEIDDIIGSRAVTLNDAPNMPYTGRFMKEIFRIATSSPFSNFQETMEDVEFHGYRIPKGTIVIGNIFGQHYNDEIWEDPSEFKPERFMENADNPVPQIIPFSVGLRTCVGQIFARNVFFLLLVSLYQKFSFEFDTDFNAIPSSEQIANDCHISLFRFAKFYKYKVKERGE